MPAARAAPRERYDAVVVGGGHNGLAAAAYLARAGRSVLVLERSPRLGGAAVSETPFAGVPARISSYAYLVSLLPAQVVRELGLAVRLAPREVSSYTPDPRAGGARGLLVAEDDPQATSRSFAAVSGGESEHRAWVALQARLRALAQTIFPTMTEPLRSREAMRSAVGEEDWEMLFERPLADLLGTALGDDVTRGVALTDGLIGTFAAAGERDLRQNRCFLYHVIGGCTGAWQVPVGGMGAISEALAAAALAAGAELRTGCEALALEPGRDGVAVRFTDGGAEHLVRGAHALVAASPAELDMLLGNPVGSRPEGSQLKVNLLLSRLPGLRDPLVAPRRAFTGTFHVNETASQLQRAYEQAAGGSIPDPVPCEAYCHSLTDPSILGPELREAGAHTLTVFALHMPARLFEDDPELRREQALAATLASLDSVLAEPIEDCVMRDQDGRRCVRVHSPLDLEAELRMPGGHIFHRDLAWPFAEHDDEVGRWGVETGHPRVLLCGAGARRGGGVSAIPGRNAAMALLGAG